MTVASTNWSSVGRDYKAEGARGILHLQLNSWVRGMNRQPSYFLPQPKAALPKPSLILDMHTGQNDSTTPLAWIDGSFLLGFGSTLITKSPEGALLTDVGSDPGDSWELTLSQTSADWMREGLHDLVLLVNFTAEVIDLCPFCDSHWEGWFTVAAIFTSAINWRPRLF